VHGAALAWRFCRRAGGAAAAISGALQSVSAWGCPCWHELLQRPCHGGVLGVSLAKMLRQQAPCSAAGVAGKSAAAASSLHSCWSRLLQRWAWATVIVRAKAGMRCFDWCRSYLFALAEPMIDAGASTKPKIVAGI